MIQLRGHGAQPESARWRYIFMHSVKARALTLRARVCSGLALIGLVAASCGSSSHSSALPHAAGTRLANESDQVAALLARGDGCGAARAAARLRAEASRMAASAHLSQTIAAQLQQRAGALASSISCVPPAPPAREPTPNSGHSNHGGGDGGDGGGD